MTYHQPTLWDRPVAPVAPRDPTVPAEAKPRLSRQCHAILERLRTGPATNHELAAIALKYTGRLSDLRRAGHAIQCYDRNHRTGESRYRLLNG